MSFPDICPACGRLADKPHYDGCDADKAALFDWLAEHKCSVSVNAEGCSILTRIKHELVQCEAPTLAGAVEKAMEAENAKSHTCPVCDSAMDSPPVDHEICGNCETHFGYHDAGPRETWQERIELLRRAYAERAKEKAMEAEAK